VVHPIVTTTGYESREPAPSGVSRVPANGESIDEVTTALWVAALDGVDKAVELGRTLPVGAVKDVVLNVLPEDWRDARSVGLLQRLTDEDGSMLLAWLCRQWWDAYSLGQAHAKTGEDLR
jgi:hypothetical protein